MSSTVFLCTLFSSATINLVTLHPSIENPHYDESLADFVLPNFNRTRRQTTSSVCSELHKTEDSPFIALIIIHESGRLQCIGTIIDEYHVLTARDCYQERDISSLMVIGGYASPYFGRHSQVKYVHKIAKHPRMGLAILSLRKPFTFTSTVQPIRLIGPKKISAGFGAYNQYRPFLVAGFQFPSKFYPLRGDLIPKGLTYQIKEDNRGRALEGGPEDCPDGCSKAGVTCPQLDKKNNYCTHGDSELCWTALGSPTMVTIENKMVQIAMVTFAKCRYLDPTPKPDTPQKDRKLEYSPYVHLRIDWFWKWIKANSFVENSVES